MDAFKLLTMFGLLYVTFGYQISRDQDIKEERNEVECPPGYLCTKIENKEERNEVECPPGYLCTKIENKGNKQIKENQKEKDDQLKPNEEQVKQNDDQIEPSEHPLKPSEHPLKPSEKPFKPSEKPFKPSEKPLKPSEKPLKPSEEPNKDNAGQQFVPVHLQFFAHKVRDDKENNGNVEKRVEDFVPVDIQLFRLTSSKEDEDDIELTSDILRENNFRSPLGRRRR